MNMVGDSDGFFAGEILIAFEQDSGEEVETRLDEIATSWGDPDGSGVFLPLELGA
jgi:hypothetical protein